MGDVVLALREDAFAAVMQRDLSFYDQYASGRIVSRVTSDTQDFATVVTLTIDLLSQLLLVVRDRRVMLFAINVSLALLTLAVVPVVFIAALSFRRARRAGPPSAASAPRRGQRDHPGDDQRHRGGQELPAGGGDLRRFPSTNQHGLPRPAAARAWCSAASSR